VLVAVCVCGGFPLWFSFGTVRRLSACLTFVVLDVDGVLKSSCAWMESNGSEWIKMYLRFMTASGLRWAPTPRHDLLWPLT
jgi:hypothetical protein